MRTIRVILIIVAGMFYANIASAVQIEVLPSSQTVDLGDQAVIEVVFDPFGPGGPLLGGFDITVGWDASILDLIDWAVDPAGALGLFPLEFVSPGADQINLFVVSFAPDLTLFQDQDSPFSLFTLTFDTVGLGTSPIDYLSLLLSDETGFFPVFPEIVLTGQVTVQEAVSVPEPSSLLLLMTGLLFLGVRKRVGELT